MQTPFPFEPFLAFGTMSIFLLIGIFIRAKVRFFQTFLIPSCMIAGFLGMIALNTGIMPFEAQAFETFAYHFFIISFISIGLTHSDEGGGGAAGEKKTGSPLKGAAWMAMIEGITVSTQAIVGCALVLLFGVFGTRLFPTFGLFLPLGFTEGPGQALSFGKSWEAHGFENAATIGLTFAAVGFLVAFFVGIPIVRWGVKRGLPAEKPTAIAGDIQRGIISRGADKEKAGELTMHSGNVETFAFQMALVGFIYVLTYFLSLGLVRITSPNIAQSLFGFFFFFAMIMALLVRFIMKKLGIMHMIDPGIQRRITGWSVDFLLVATITAIQLVVVIQYIVPIAVMSVAGVLITIFPILYLGKRIDRLNFERTMTIFGTCTGTVSTGLLLLRVIDPEFRTPVALETGLMNVVVFPIIASSMVLVNAPVWWHWPLWLVILAHVPILIVSLVVIRLMKMWGAPKY
ncbi:MAG: hypothetical protein JXA20_12940 [Spirochaetes bacterium]|nr:hypothetical protein [Spirochaetota bacterium]